MKYLPIPIALAVIVLLIALVLRSRKNVAQATLNEESATPLQRDPQAAATQTLEQKLHALAACGLSLRPKFTVDDLLSSWDRDDYEKPGYDMALVGLGMTQEEPPWEPHCDNLWHFDTECIEDHGSYADIARRMSDMAGGSLPLTDIEDYVDLEEGKAWLTFQLNGVSTRIDCKVNDDWVDTDVLGVFARLLEKNDSDKLYLYYDLDGQDCIIGCLDRTNYTKLRQLIPQVKPLS